MKAVGLAAIGTVADVVPLVDENRILVHHGLASLGGRPGLGMQRLLQLTKLAEKPCLQCEDIGFMLAPRLNAAGRLGQAQLAVELLTTTSADRAVRSGRLSARIEQQPRQPRTEHLSGRA